MLIFGLALVAWAAINLIDQKEILVYSLPAPTGDDAPNRLTQWFGARTKLLDTLSDGAEAVAVGGIAQKVSLSNSDRSVEATVMGIDEGWAQVYPLFYKDGRSFSSDELAGTTRVMLLDENAAFTLFGSSLPEDASVTLGDADYRVIGVVRAQTRIGLPADARAYIPFLSGKDALYDLVALSVRSNGAAGMEAATRAAAEASWQAGGSLYSLQKEGLRALLLPRTMTVLALIVALSRLARAWRRLAEQCVARCRRALRERYLMGALPSILGSGALMLAALAVLIGLAALLTAFAVRPVYQFPEWVPEDLSSLSSIRSVLRERLRQSAQLVRTGTPERMRIDFFASVSRWGTALALLGAALAGISGGKRDRESL